MRGLARATHFPEQHGYEIPISRVFIPSRFQMAFCPSCRMRPVETALHERDTAMLALSEHRDFPELDERLRDASKATTELMSQILARGRRPSASARRNAKAARLECLIRAEAWTDAALALIDLEL